MNESPPRAGNVWYHWPGAGCPPSCKLPPQFSTAEAANYDVAIIGAGVVGCALAYEMSQYRLRIIVIDRAYDVGEGTSKGNSAIIHTGFDAEPGSLESQLVTAASRQWPELAQKLKIPFKAVEALMLALNAEQLAQLPALRDKALANGVDDVRLLAADEVRRLEPNASPQTLGGLLVPRESIIDPFTTSIAYADVALQNGVDIALGVAVAGVQIGGETKHIIAENGLSFRARYVINACGLGSRRLADSYVGEPMTLNPRRGQFLVYDSQSSPLVGRILLPIPTKKTKGMLVAPTIFGNLLAGPTAEDLRPDQLDATNTTAEGLAAVRASAVQMCPALAAQPVIATYAGLRCNCAEGSYWIRYNDGGQGVVTLAGIRSTGLTASISTAQHVVRQMAEHCGLPLVKNELAVDSRPESRWPGWWKRPFEDPRRLAARAAYGRIVCSCENISHGEIEDALELAAGVATLDGLKRRTRVLTGRCQGFNCCVPAAEIIARHFGVPLDRVTKRGPGSEFIAKCEQRPPQPIAATPMANSSPRQRYRVLIIGAGPAGIGAAVGLARAGVDGVLLVDRASRVGGVPAHYEIKPDGVPTFVAWRRGRVLFGAQYVNLLTNQLRQTQTNVQLETQVLSVDAHAKAITLVSPAHGKADIFADAVVFACGARERSGPERGWIVGDRPARQFNTMQLLQLIDGRHALPAERPLILGSDLIAYSAAAKLRAAGAQPPAMCDKRGNRPAAWWERLYFRRWCRPVRLAASGEVVIEGQRSATGVRLGGQHADCDSVVVSGELVSNSELLVAAGFQVRSPDRAPVRVRVHELSQPGWFVVGAALGGLHGADWCYRDGRRAAAAVRNYLQSRC